MEMIEPVFVSDHQFSVVGQTYLEETEAEEFLSGYLALWHPLVLSRMAALPRICSVLDLTGQVAKILAVVGGKEKISHIQTQLVAGEESKGWAFGAANPRLLAEIGLALGAGESPISDLESSSSFPMNCQELESAFRGLGLGLAWVDSVFESQNHTNLLDREGLLNACRQGAQDWQAGDFAGCSQKLRDAAELLTQAREQVIGGTPRVLESVDWDSFDRIEDAHLPKGAGFGLPCSVWASGERLEQTANLFPERIEKLKGCQDKLQVCGGRYSVRSDSLQPVSSQLWNLRKGQMIHRGLFGEYCPVVVHPGTDLHPGLPTLWRQCGFQHAIFRFGPSGFENSDQSAVNSKVRCSIVSWSSGDGMGVETLARPPLSAGSARCGIDLAYHFQKSQSLDYCPLLHFQSVAPEATGWFVDFLSLCSLAPVMGTHCIPTEVLRNASPGDYWSSATADEMMPDPGSVPLEGLEMGPDWAKRVERQNIQAKWAFTSMLALLEGGKEDGVPKDWEISRKEVEDLEERFELNGTLEPIDFANSPGESPESRLARRILVRGKTNVPGWLVLNPCSFTRRAVVQLPGTKIYKVEGPVRACQVETGQTVSLVVEVPSYGFCWLPREGELNPASMAAGLRLADERGVRNEFLEGDIDPSTGEIRGIRDSRSRRPRLSIQLAGQTGTAMVHRQINVISRGPARGEIESQGELVDSGNKKIGEFSLGLKTWLGRPVLEVVGRVEMAAGSQPAMAALKLVWRDPSMDLRRGWMGQAYRLREGYQRTGEWLEISEGAATATILPQDFPLCRRVGKRSMELPFGFGGKKVDQPHCLGIALDRDFPFLMAQGLESPLPCVPVDRGPPPSGISGWLGMMDHANVVVTDLRPCDVNGRQVLNWQLINTSQEGFELGLSLAKKIQWASGVDALGQEQRSATVEDYQARLFLQRVEWAGLSIAMG